MAWIVMLGNIKNRVGRAVHTAVGDGHLLCVVHTDDAVKGAQLDLVFVLLLAQEHFGRDFVRVHEIHHLMAREGIPEEIVAGEVISLALLCRRARLGL